MSQHFAEYGNAILQRKKCRDCESFAFVIDDVLQCCGKPATFEANKVKKMCAAAPYRRTPPTRVQRDLLKKQEGRCLYCGLEFGSIVSRNGDPLILKLHWDHQVPFSYTQNNDGLNFCAACHVCNLIKSSKMFQTVDEAAVYITNVREAKGYSV